MLSFCLSFFSVEKLSPDENLDIMSNDEILEKIIRSLMFFSQTCNEALTDHAC